MKEFIQNHLEKRGVTKQTRNNEQLFTSLQDALIEFQEFNQNFHVEYRYMYYSKGHLPNRDASVKYKNMIEGLVDGQDCIGSINIYKPS